VTKNYKPRHARPRERHPVTGQETANTALIALGDLISALSVLIALWALHVPPAVHATAPAQFPAIVCYQDHPPVHCQVAEIRSLSP
jgi:hypothetical protein